MTLAQFKEILARGHIYTSVYHFTARENLPSIKQNGIVSKQYAIENNVAVSVYGGNEWSHDADTLKGLNGFVSLCFTQSHPMCHIAHIEGRIKNPVCIPIDPDVLSIAGAKITIGVANKCGIDLLDVEEGLARLDTEVLYTRTDWNNGDIQQRLRTAEKCEILIPHRVAPNFLRQI